MSSTLKTIRTRIQAPTGTNTQINEISGGAVAVGQGAVATAVYQGLTVEEVSDLVVQLKHKDQPKVWDGRIPPEPHPGA